MLELLEQEAETAPLVGAFLLGVEDEDRVDGQARDLQLASRRAYHEEVNRDYVRREKQAFRDWFDDIQQTRVLQDKILKWPSQKFWDDISDFPILGKREVWEFENPTSVMHPMHVHLVKFQILDKTDMTTGQPVPLQPWEVNTWKDIVHIPPNVRARIIMDFEDYPGRFPNHCHLLDHEDHEMMRQFQTTGGQCNNNGTCEFLEDFTSCPNDCPQLSGALCGNGLCEAGDGENCLTCPVDCAGKTKGGNAFCCGASTEPRSRPGRRTPMPGAGAHPAECSARWPRVRRWPRARRRPRRATAGGRLR